ncbi:MAG: uracil-DNA glycosylase [Myxococcota bacterium]
MKPTQDLPLQIVQITRSMKAQLQNLQDCGYTVVPRAHACNKQTQQVMNHAPTPTESAPESLLNLASKTQGELDQLRQEKIGDCMRCKLCSHRTHIVFGVGNPQAQVVFVGEAPGAAEDAQGEPFVGRAGQLLTRMIEAMGLKRQDVYICNVIKCRPPDNRDPEPDEVRACEPFLKKQLSILKPKVIVALGRYACQCLLRTNRSMSQLRGSWSTYEGVCLMPTFHPAYLLRSPSKKREVWEDLRQVLQKLKETV